MPQQHDRPKAPKHDRDHDRAALLIIDMINGFQFPEADKLKPKALRIADRIRTLRQVFVEAQLPVVYVNDNFGEWHSERSRIIGRAIDQDDVTAGMLAPEPDDYFIIKPQFSGFYATNLPVLLPKLGVTRLVLTGIQTDICVLFTAADAHMRDYALWVPSDCVASEDAEREAAALRILQRSMGAEISSTAELDLRAWCSQLRLKDDVRH